MRKGFNMSNEELEYFYDEDKDLPIEKSNMKRDAGSDGEGPNKKIRKNDEVIRLLIPSKIAGAIIGKGGQNIQKLRAQYKATVSVDDCQGPERTVLISSDMESVCNILAEMLKNFEEKEEGEIDLRLLIHQSLAGCVIGKAGSKIKELRDKIGSRIKIFSNLAPQSTDRIVQILGKPDHCIDSIKEIVNLVKSTPVRGPVHNYDPLNFDDVYAEEYGGYGASGGGNGFRNGGRFSGGSGSARGGDRSGMDRFGDRGDRRGDMDRSRGGGPMSRGGGSGMESREFVDPWARPPMGNGGGPMGGNSPNMNMSMGGMSYGGGMGNGSGMGGGAGGVSGGNGMGMGGGGGGGSGMGMGGGSMGGGMSGSYGMGGGGVGGNMSNMGGSGGGSGPLEMDEKNTTQVTIPKDLAGAIIGKGGGRIRRIRTESNAFITIDEPLRGSNDRIITITGTPKQIQTAQYLLQQSVHENRRKF
ncbi:heterogeneous nuclear ribonucleoprotein K isoform X2 [Phlebotomus papatasi]|uniref:heterogeneous nuclear ribonucleoprotein K isoform X2 n=1 Tax=Phlebotomus papatasi TaxID=29031 RepID=UPI0024840ED0|nr:heterogeneous nuclear ribonucleoprotein K isoform X2 [Phlebotomus papatasi]